MAAGQKVALADAVDPSARQELGHWRLRLASHGELRRLRRAAPRTPYSKYFSADAPTLRASLCGCFADARFGPGCPLPAALPAFSGTAGLVWAAGESPTPARAPAPAASEPQTGDTATQAEVETEVETETEMESKAGGPRFGVDTLEPEPAAAAVWGPPVGLLLPHGGFCNSGFVAAHGFAALRARPPPRRVVVIANNHRAWHKVALSDQPWATPLGRVVPAPALVAAMQRRGYAVDRAAHAEEHSLENQLPFLQATLPLGAASHTGGRVILKVRTSIGTCSNS
jgi:hypothetical protein